MNKHAHKMLFTQCCQLLEANHVPLDESMLRLMEYFFEADHHITLKECEDFVRREGLALLTPAIAKTLELLVEYGFATEKSFLTGTTYYEHLHLDEHHDHCYCLRCGAIIEFFSPALEEIQKQEAKRHGFHPFSHRLQINGLCDSCFSHSRRKLTPLVMVQPGCSFRIMEIQHGGVLHFPRGGGLRRLAELGLAPNLEGRVISNAGLMFVVQIGGNRLALRRGQAHKIMVQLLEP
jgi:Fur family ferric uptake transcriptional regulator